MHKQHPQTAYRKYAILIGTIFENCDKSSTIREAVKLLSSKGIVERQQADEEAAPAHDPNQKTARPRSDMLQGLAVIFYGKKSCFSGLLRVLSLCGDHDDTHCYRVAFLIGSFVKRSAHVVDFCRLFPEQIKAIPSPAWHK